MSKFITEILAEVNADPATLVKYRENNALRFLFQYAFIPEKKFDLPEGAPPYKKDAAPIGMSPANFAQETRRLYIFTKERELQKLRRESLFVQLLEALHPSEAEVLIAVKDQTLDQLYPNITIDAVADAGFIPMELKGSRQVVKKRGRPPKEKNGSVA